MRKYLLRIILFLSPLLLHFTSVYAQQAPNPVIFINDVLTPLTSSSIQSQDKVYIPLRALCELLGFQVSFDPTIRSINASYKDDTFIHHLAQNTQTFNGTSVSINLFIQDNLTYVEANTFLPLFGFDVDYDQTLFISTYLGQELLELDYLPTPILIDVYDDIPVTSILINEIQPSIVYSQGCFSAKIIDCFYEGENLFITFLPYTLIPCPLEYNTLSTPSIINFDSTPLTLPISSSFKYDYILGQDTYITSNDLSLFYFKLDRGEFYLTQLTTSNAQITSLKQLYTP